MQEMIQYSSTKDLVEDAYKIVDSSQHFAYRSVNTALVLRNWLLGKRIVEEELKGANRAEYGAEVIKRLSDSLTLKYGKGFNKRTVYKFRQFYNYFPEIVGSLTAQSDGNSIVPSATAQLLSWTHYEKLIQVSDADAREWYAKEAYEQTWSVRTLQRNISSQYYYRILKSQDKSGVEEEMRALTSHLQDKLEYIKNPDADEKESICFFGAKRRLLIKYDGIFSLNNPDKKQINARHKEYYSYKEYCRLCKSNETGVVYVAGPNYNGAYVEKSGQKYFGIDWVNDKYIKANAPW